MAKRQNKATGGQGDIRLLQALAEQIKLPLLQIARRAELAKMGEDPYAQLASMELTADTALKLIDNYLLSTRLTHENIHLEPVSVSAVLANVAHQLAKTADDYQCTLEMHLAGKYEPIMADSAGLTAALTSLGYVFIEAQATRENDKRSVIKLGAHRGKQGIVAGMFTDTEGLSADMLRRGRKIYGQARQPLAQLTATSGAGVFVAEAIFNAMSVRLRPAKHQKLMGLAGTFVSSHQLNLI